MIIWRGHGRWLWCAAFEVTFASNVGENASSGGSNVLSTPYYYTLLESPWCLLSNAVESTLFGALQLELYSVEGAEASWPHCRLPPCSFMHIAGQFSPSISVHHAVPYMLGKLLIPNFQCFLNHLIWSSVAQVILVGSIPLVCLVVCGANVSLQVRGLTLAQTLALLPYVFMCQR